MADQVLALLRRIMNWHATRDDDFKSLIVRGMARQSILVMGLSARDYLIEQRAKASPELQVEIDRIWRQIKRQRTRE